MSVIVAERRLTLRVPHQRWKTHHRASYELFVPEALDCRIVGRADSGTPCCRMSAPKVATPSDGDAEDADGTGCVDSTGRDGLEAVWEDVLTSVTVQRTTPSEANKEL